MTPVVRAVTFDLDDTLYPEIQFVESGFAAVANELESAGECSAKEFLGSCLDVHLSIGRDNVFNQVIADLGIDDKLLPMMIAAYRDHIPSRLVLYTDALEVLHSLRGNYRVGIITDGWLEVQQRKFAALEMADLVDAVVFSDEFGRPHWKPSAVPFQECSRRLGVTPAETIHVGDNPERDVVGARAAGASPILLRRSSGYFAETLVEGNVPVITNLWDLVHLLSAM